MSPVPALELATRRLRSAPAGVVLVDGRSGSGKTTFAAALAARTGATLLRLEDLYPGWDGLAAASCRLVAGVLVPRSAGVPGTASTWDWGRDGPGAVRRVEPGRSLIVEGCGALSRRAAAHGVLAVWVDLAEPLRRARALSRDGDVYAPHWERWARQERAFASREDPRRLADLVVDGRCFPQPPFSGSAADGH